MANCRKNSRKNMRKNSRKNMRKNSRKNMRKNSRKNSRMNMMGGNPMQLSLAQGKEYVEFHKEQRGGGAALMGAPVGYTGVLDDSLRASARVGPLDMSMRDIQGMSDMPAPVAVTHEQTGGRRKTSRKSKKDSRKNRKVSRKSKKDSRKNRKVSRKSKKDSRKNRKVSRKSKKDSRKANVRKMYGGSAPVTDSFELLSPAMRMKAGTGDFSNPLLLK